MCKRTNAQPVFREHIVDAHLNKLMFLIVVITIQGCVHESSDEFHHTFTHILLGVITKTDTSPPPGRTYCRNRLPSYPKS